MAISYDDFGPEKIIEVYDPKTRMKGYVVLYNTVLGPAKGGIRITQSVDKDEVVRLARVMTWKCALAELPFGGGKGSIMAPKTRFNVEMKNRWVAAFGHALRFVSPSLYVAAPDIGTTEEQMRVFAEANGDVKSCTGKPVEMGGLPHELGSTGFGVYHAALVAMEYAGIPIKGATVAIEGFGNVGSFVFKYLTEAGAKVIAVSDSKGTLYNDSGLKFDKVTEVKKDTRSVINYKPGAVVSNRALFELNVDLLIPAAIPDVIADRNVDKIKAKVIVVASNIAMKPEIEEKLYDKGIIVVPDFVANAGGVISSYIEYIGGDKEQMFKMVEEKIVKNTRAVLNKSRESKIAPRDAALVMAKQRIRAAMKERDEKG